LRSPLRAVGFVAAAVLASLPLAALLAWRAVAPVASQREQVLASISQHVGFPIDAGSIEISWLPPAIVARDLTVPDESPYGPGTLAYAEEARFDLSVRSLLRGRIVVDEVRLQSPVVRAVRGADGGWNLRRRGAAVAAAGREARPASPAPGLSVETVRVRGGRIALRDRGVAGVGEHELRDVNLLLRRRDGRIDVDFDGRALGGDDRNLSGRVRVAPEPAAPARFEIEAGQVEGARLAELVALLRGRLPFGLSVEGPLDLRLTGTATAEWPPPAAELDLTVGGRGAALATAGGWIRKTSGRDLEGDLRLRWAPGSLALVSADLRLEGGRLLVREDGPTPGPGQGTLAISSEGLDARAIAGWVPALAVVEPTGPLAVEGRLEPGRPARGRIELGGEALRVSAAGVPVDLGDGRIRLDVDEEGSGLSGSLEVGRVSGDGARLGGVEGRIAGRRDRVQLELAAREGNWRGAPLERIALEGAMVDDGFEIRAARADALGGAVLARGRIERADGTRWRAAIDPRLESIDLAGLLAVAGSTSTGRGRVAGAARLSTEGSDLREALRNLAGDFDLVLRDGEIGGLNVASTALSGLRGVPGLREAVLRGARADAPGLLSSASPIGELSASGRVGEGQVHLDRFRLVADDYTFDGRGRVGFDGETDLDGRLAISRKASKALVSESGLASLLSGGDGLVTIPVVLRGTWPQVSGAPTGDFLGRLARRAVGGRDGGEIGDLVKRLLGGRGARRTADETDGAGPR